jgi:hypothetical protein
MTMDLNFKGMKVIVWKETFAVAKSRKPIEDAFAVIQDKKEITVIAEQSKINGEDVIEAKGGWRILTFDTVLPFDLVGFLAKISRALAEENISILAISSFSTDHILVREKDLDRAIEKLESLGFSVEVQK